MHTSTASSASLAVESTLRRKLQAFLVELRRALEVVGQAYSHGLPPL